ncbi:MAG: hypothetical protein H5U02_00245 [Clostridia bacterium]|nr:hypothetical protein [Clostridia bacterium]
MTYEIVISNIGDWLWQADITVKDEASNVVLEGRTTVSCETEQEVYEYAEKVFLPDLRMNFPKQIGGVVFPWEVQEPAGEPA